MVANLVKKNRFVAFLSVTAATLSLTATSALSQTDEIRVDGSSTVFPITEAVAEEFMSGDPSANVTVGVSGTGGGFRRFCAGETEISNASRPIKPEEVDACREGGVRFIELPVAYDALTVVVHPENTWASEMTVEQLNTIWSPEAQGVITNWNQVDPSFPDLDLVLYGPGTDSGTFDYFTEAVNGDGGASRADFTASEDDNVLVQGVANDEGSIGYFGLAYYLENQDRLNSVAIINPDTGAPVQPSADAVEANEYVPLSRPLFIYVNADAVENNPAVREFVEYYLSRSDLALEVGYVPLPAEAYDAARANLREGKTGTVFGSGVETIGVSIEDLLELEGIE
jgi:phosphate transport system substrate-binding protein